MQKKILISLVLIVLLPVGLLAGLGLRMAHNEQQVVQVQVKALIDAQLASVDEAITGYFFAVQNDLVAAANTMNLATESLINENLKIFTEQSRHVRHVLVIDAEGKRIYPLPTAILSVADTQFVQRTAAILDNPFIMTQGEPLSITPSNAVSFISRQNVPSKIYNDNAAESATANESKEASKPQSGWYAWHWNAELHHIFWMRNSQNYLIGFELSPVAVLSDIIARLPATSDKTTATHSNTRLINGNGQIVYEWGQYQAQKDEKSIAMLPLNHPLGSWKLEYFAPVLTNTSTANTLNILLGVILIGLALIALATYLYREHQREVRVAQQRVNFVNQVSHELKTPLTNIRLYAELLETEVDDIFAEEPQQEGDKARKYIAIITAESQRLSRLIANVLRFGQFQKAELQLRLQSANVDEVIQRCITAFTPALQAKGIAVQLDLQAGAQVLLDVEVLEQIFNNLISNVEKYAASGAVLNITSKQHNDISNIAVRDFGPGIAARERQRIFQPFYRVSSLLTDGVTGTGIGLDIARQLARLHGGDLVLQDVDIGACFIVSLHTEIAKEIV